MKNKTELTRDDCVILLVLFLLGFLGIVFITQLPMFEKFIYQIKQ